MNQYLPHPKGTDLETSAFSHWEHSGFLTDIDTLIIGGGIVGLNAAIQRKKLAPNERVVVFEKAAFGFGGSTRNAGFACFGSPTEILSDLRNLSDEVVIRLIKMRWEGLNVMLETLGKSQVDYIHSGSVELFTESESDLYQEVKLKLDLLNEIASKAISHSPYVHTEASDLQQRYGFSRVLGGYENTEEGSIDTGKMFYSLRKKCLEIGIEMYHGIEVFSWKPGDRPEVKIENETVQCSNLIICTNGFAKDLISDLDLSTARNLVMITEPIPELKVNGTFHMNEGYVYFRNVGNRLLIGGARHLDRDWMDRSSPPEEVSEYLKTLVSEVILPNTKWTIDRQWVGFLGVGSQKTPIVEEVDKNVYLAVRMGGMGVAIGSLIGKTVAELLG